ncbi:MAG: zinc-ribbon domain-containing protein [Candidatus Aenigmatarchaeota archaeon]|nr:MAG: zinc-ribbon domain-containing protein [Candidatus Aenigmarchaeota archaeon]
MICERCGNDLEEGWRFCPRCGLQKGGSPLDAFGRDLFSKMFKRMDKMFESDMQAIDLSPLFRLRDTGDKPVKRGLTIHVKRGTGMKPKVDIETFGNVSREMVEKEVQNRFGIPGKDPEERKEKRRIPIISRMSGPKVTEEPKADVRRTDSGFAVDVQIPEVKDEHDIEVRELGSSVEIKAVAGDKAYFKIITKPENLKLSGKSFRHGTLHLELS